jgi:hypothetical protein
MDTIWIAIVAVFVWIILQVWLLPKFGIST